MHATLVLAQDCPFGGKKIVLVGFNLSNECLWQFGGKSQLML